MGWALHCRLVSPHAEPVAQAHLPAAQRLISHPEGALRVAGRRLAGVRRSARLAVFDLDALLAGDPRPVAEFPVPWPGWAAPHAFTPDLTTAVCSGPDRVSAVGPAGDVRWEWRHESVPWGRDRTGSAFVTVDGRQVWAVVPGTGHPEWIVLDAGDGRLLGRFPLPWAANGHRHVAHPDGGLVGLNLIADDACGVYWGRLTAEGLRVTEVCSDEEIVADVDPAGRLMATVNMSGYFVGLRRVPDGEDDDGGDDVVAYADSPRPRWSTRGGFLGPDTFLACSRVPEHWLFTAASGLSGPIRYPGPATEYVRPLGDGTWLTAHGETLSRWRLRAGYNLS
jgi:hypothetical protein